MIWQLKLAIWTVGFLALLPGRIWVQKRIGRISGSRRSVVMSVLAGACFVETFGVIVCVPHTVSLFSRLAVALGLFAAYNVFDWLTPKPTDEAKREPAGQPA